MSILIKGMEIPKSCDQCRFFAWSRGVGQYCAVDDRITFHATIDGLDVSYERNDDCPFVPVPPHGRLIDADALDIYRREEQAWRDYEKNQDDEYLEGVKDGLHEAAKQLSTAPTIIEAKEDANV